jgi:hypothetical protein
MIDEINETILVEEENIEESPKRDENIGLYDENGEIKEEKTEEE